MYEEPEDSVLLVLVDTSTSIGFDEVKPKIVDAVNVYLGGRTGKILFFNHTVSDVYTRNSIHTGLFEMSGQTRLWDSFGKVIDMYPYQNINIGVYTDAKDTGSRKYTQQKVMSLVKTLRWNVTWLYESPEDDLKSRVLYCV